MKATSNKFKPKNARSPKHAASSRRSAAKVKPVASDDFDPQRQAGVLANMARIREELAKEGKWFTREDIKSAIEEGRR
jgi:hypothetical protein